MLFWGNSVRRVHGSALRTALKWDLQGVHSRVAMKSWLWIDPVGWHVRPGWGKLLILHSQPQRTGRCWDLYCSLTRVVTIVTQGSSSSWQLGHLCPYCCRTARLESVPPDISTSASPLRLLALALWSLLAVSAHWKLLTVNTKGMHACYWKKETTTRKTALGKQWICSLLNVHSFHTQPGASY